MAQKMTFQEIIATLNKFWAKKGCIIGQPYDIEKGAATMHPSTFFRVLGPEPWKVAYIEPCRRPTDGRYGENPNRLYHYYQYQVVLKPSPLEVQDIYLDSLRALGVDPKKHDIRFVEDNWESPTLGAWGVGWEVWLESMEITQFTYFQQCGGYDLHPISAELTYGLERIAMFIQKVDNVFDITWTPGVKYKEIHLQGEKEHSQYSFNTADIDSIVNLFNIYEGEALRQLNQGLILPAYDYALKCSHAFNLLDSRGAISVTERTAYILRIRKLTRICAKLYLEQREKMGYPLLRRK